MNSQLLDVEHRFNLLQADKLKVERDSQFTEDSHLRTIESLRIRNDELLDRISRLEGETRNLATEVEIVRDGKIAAQREATLAKEEAKLSPMKERSKTIEIELENQRLQRKYDEVRDHVHLLTVEKSRLETEVDLAREGKRARERELDLMMGSRSAEKAKRELERKNIDLELELIRTRRKYEDVTSLVDNKEKELNQARRLLDYEESRNSDVKDKVRQLEREKDTLEYMAEKNKKDAELNRKLAMSEMDRNLELSRSKKEVERKAVESELEAMRAKREKARLEELAESGYMNSEELEAVKEHAEVLGYQNRKLVNEIEQIVDEDENIGRELDRKRRVDMLKTRNEEELQRSAEKVRQHSPQRSPYRSPNKYSSPYRSPSKY